MQTIIIDFDRISEAVQQALDDNHFSELALAEKSGVSQPVLNRIARGEHSAPSLPTFKRLWPFIGKYLVRHTDSGSA
jgi:predicted transcriptional regulator